MQSGSAETDATSETSEAAAFINLDFIFFTPFLY